MSMNFEANDERFKIKVNVESGNNDGDDENKEKEEDDEYGDYDDDEEEGPFRKHARKVMQQLRANPPVAVEDLSDEDRFIAEANLDEGSLQFCADILAAFLILHNGPQPVTRDCLVRALQRVVAGFTASQEAVAGAGMTTVEDWLVQFASVVNSGWQEWMLSAGANSPRAMCPFPTQASFVGAMLGLMRDTRDDELAPHVRMFAVTYMLLYNDPGSPAGNWPVPYRDDSIACDGWRLTATKTGYGRAISAYPASALEYMVRHGLPSLIDPFIHLCGHEDVGALYPAPIEPDSIAFLGNSGSGMQCIYQLVMGVLVSDAHRLSDSEPRPARTEAILAFLNNSVVVASIKTNPPTLNLWIDSIVHLAPPENELIRILRAQPNLIPPMDEEMQQALAHNRNDAFGLASNRLETTVAGYHYSSSVSFFLLSCWWDTWATTQLSIYDRRRQAAIYTAAGQLEFSQPARYERILLYRLVQLVGRRSGGAPDPLTVIRWETVLQIQEHLGVYNEKQSW